MTEALGVIPVLENSVSTVQSGPTGPTKLHPCDSPFSSVIHLFHSFLLLMAVPIPDIPS